MCSRPFVADCPSAVADAEHPPRPPAPRSVPTSSPSQNPDDREAAQERFVRVTAAYHFLKSPAGARARDGGDAAGGVAADFDWGAFTPEGGFKMPSLEEILGMALGGTNMSEVDEMLRAVGQHRPPEGFGIAPFPAFTAAERSAEDAKREHAQRTYLESIKADERASAAHECAVAILAEDGDSRCGAAFFLRPWLDLCWRVI